MPDLIFDFCTGNDLTRTPGEIFQQFHATRFQLFFYTIAGDSIGLDINMPAIDK
jgi:hypothetical protein